MAFARAEAFDPPVADDPRLVMDPDAAKRANRLALLRGLGVAIARVADLSQLVLERAEPAAADA